MNCIVFLWQSCVSNYALLKLVLKLVCIPRESTHQLGEKKKRKKEKKKRERERTRILLSAGVGVVVREVDGLNIFHNNEEYYSYPQAYP